MDDKDLGGAKAPKGESLPMLPAPKLSAAAHAKAAHVERLAAAAAKEKARVAFHADIKKHIAEANSEQNDSADPHPFVHEHAELRGFGQVQLIDPATMQPVSRPCWQMQALVAHFHAHGLRHDSRISAAMFDQALDEALKGRV
jgi:hypothetical protein